MVAWNSEPSQLKEVTLEVVISHSYLGVNAFTNKFCMEMDKENESVSLQHVEEKEK